MRAVLDRAPCLPQGQGICHEPNVHRWGAASGRSLWPQLVCTARCHAVGTACVPCGASIERVEIEEVGECDRRVTADPDGQRERVLVGEGRQRDEFLLRTRTHSCSGAAARAWWVMGQAAPRLGRRWSR